MVLSKQEKAEAVGRMKKELKQYPVVAVASLQNLPAKHFNSIKKKLRGKAVVQMTRSTLLARAIDEGRPELKQLEQNFSGSTALVLTSMGAFQLFKTLKQNKSKTAAKPGQAAPADLVIPAGETNLAPGPVLTELKQAGIQAKIQGPKIVITSDAVVAKKGEPVSDAAAKILAKLGIEPMEIGLKLTAVWEKQVIYPPEILDIDDAAYVSQIQLAHQQAVNLGVFAEIFNSVTTPLIIGKAARAANAVKAVVDSKTPPAPSATEHAKESAATEQASQAIGEETKNEQASKTEQKAESLVPPSTEQNAAGENPAQPA